MTLKDLSLGFFPCLVLSCYMFRFVFLDFFLYTKLARLIL